MQPFDDPNWFLSSFDADRAELSFLQTDRETLSGAAFHDGRTPLAIDGGLINCPLAEALDWQNALNTLQIPINIIAHMSFCGSTLLARALEQDGEVSAYREPQILVELANLWAAQHSFTKLRPDWSETMNFVSSQFQKTWTPNQPSVVKPSNWFNNLLPEFVRQRPDTRLVLLELDLRSYLIANFRGGHLRLTYSLNLLNHLSVGRDEHRGIIAHVEQSKPSPMKRICRLLAICFNLQETFFAETQARLPSDQFVTLCKPDIVNNLEQSLGRARRIFGLPEPRGDQASIIAQTQIQNAKTDEREPFDRSLETALDKRIETDFAEDLEQTYIWYRRTFRSALPRHGQSANQP